MKHNQDSYLRAIHRRHWGNFVLGIIIVAIALIVQLVFTGCEPGDGEPEQAQPEQQKVPGINDWKPGNEGEVTLEEEKQEDGGGEVVDPTI